MTRQNMGIPGQTTAQIAARFTADVVSLKPRLALLEGGSAADIDGDLGSQSSWLANFKRMLDACQANSIKPVVLLILPALGATNSQSQKRDTWNMALRALASGYPGAVIVDATAYVGAFRPGGPPGNLWTVAQPYSAGDPWHFTPAGYQRIAQAIVDQYTEP